MNEVNPQWVNAPYSVDWLLCARRRPHWRQWSRKRQLKAIRRERKRIARQQRIMDLATRAIVEKSSKILVSGMLTLLCGPSMLIPRPFFPEPLIRPVRRTPSVLDLLD